VLAMPGDHVRWDNGQLWVNNQLTELSPLNPARIPPGIEWNVPADHYLILPSTGAAIPTDAPITIWQEVGLIPFSAIRGRVYFRTSPLSRWGRIR